MKKILVKALSLLTAFAILFTFVAGCELVTTNTERDMNQVVAKIQIDANKVDSDVILKRELLSAYNSYGYYYQAYYSYTAEQVYELIIKNLVQNRVVTQQAKIALAEYNEYTGYENGFFAAAKLVAEEDRTSTDKLLALTTETLTAKSSLEKFLTTYEIAYSKYNFYSSILSSIKNMLDEDEDEKKDDDHETITISSPRTTLSTEEDEDGNEIELKDDTDIEELKKEYTKTLKDIGLDDTLIQSAFEGKLNKYDLNLSVYNTFNNAFNDYVMNNNARRRGLIKTVRNLYNNGFITDTENKVEIKKVDDVLNIAVFKDSLDSEYESRIISKYELALENMYRKQVVADPDAIYGEFKELYNYQSQTFASVSDYETAIDADEEFILYSPVQTAGQYGYVLNLLLGFSDELSTSLSDYKADGKVEKIDVIDYRNWLTSYIRTKDQRSDWVKLNYGKLYTKDGLDYIENTSKDIDASKTYYFGFEDKYVKTDAVKYFPVEGKYITAYEKYDDYGNKVLAYTFDAFNVPEYTYSEMLALIKDKCGFTSDGTSIETVAYSEELYNKFLDLIFAYSTDSGSLAENDGYIYSSITSDSTYVEEFADDAKALIAAGAGSWKACVTDYGVHVMLCTKVLEPTSSEVLGYINDKNAFKTALTSADDNIAKDFKEYKLNLYIDNQVQQEANRFINNGIENGVTYYESTYEDLLA